MSADSDRGRADSLALRQRLFEAAAIVTVARHALASNLGGLDETTVIDALSVAEEIIDDVAGALEPKMLVRGSGGRS